MERIYMDNAATTRVTEPVMEAMQPYFCEIFGNPMSIHAFGRESRIAVEKARQQVADAIGAKPNEIYFTGCGTEADNWAVRGTAYARKNRGKHIITSAIEHHAILHTCQQLEQEGFEVTYVPVDEFGVIRMDELERAIRPDTILISVMSANNEIGTIQPIEEIAKLAHAHNILFHTDAVQAIGSIHFDVKAMGIDMLSMSGHKFHSPKGIGALYIRNGVRIQRLMTGGAQERLLLLNLDAANTLICCEELGSGSLAQVSVGAGEVAQFCVRRGFERVILAHNHPSGLDCPSREDVAMTRKLQDLLQDLGVFLVDHFVITDRAFYSMKDHGLF